MTFNEIKKLQKGDIYYEHIQGIWEKVIFLNKIAEYKEINFYGFETEYMIWTSENEYGEIFENLAISNVNYDSMRLEKGSDFSSKNCYNFSFKNCYN